MSDHVQIPAPNYTQIPNAIFDLMADKHAGLTEKELKILLAIARKTFGWHKKRDKISISQLQAMTCMSRASVTSGVKAAIARGIVRQTPDPSDNRGGVFYELVVSDPNQSTELTSSKSELVQNLNQSKIHTRTSSKSELELVQNLNTQKKDKERKERESANHARTPAVQAYFDAYPTERLNADQVNQISATVTDLKKWQEVLHYWKASNYRAQSIPKMLDRYSSGSTVATDRPNSNRQATHTRAPADLPLVSAASDTRSIASPEERKRIVETRMANK